MKKKEHSFLFCLTGTLFLTAGVVFLPRYISRSMDLGDLYQVEVSRRENFSFLEQGSNDIYDVVHAFEHLKQGEEGPVLLTAISEPIQISSDLLNEICLQITLAAEYGMLPGSFFEHLAIQVDGAARETQLELTSCVKFAQYYTLTFESEENPKKKELLNFWYVRFSDEQSYDYYFIVNAVNYQIYYAEIHNATTQRLVEEITYACKAAAGDSYGEIYDESYNGSTQRILEESMYAYKTNMLENMNPYMEIFANGCAQYYESTGYDYVSQWNLYQKLGLFILYFENEKPVYIEQSVVKSDASWQYDGICIGLQNLIRWVRKIRDPQ